LNPLVGLGAQKHISSPISALLTFFLAAIAIGGAPPPGDPAALEPAATGHVPAEWRLEAPFQSGLHCGPNSLYLLLRLSGIAVSREEVERLVPLTSAGCTLDDLRRAAPGLGLNVEIRKVTPDEVKDLAKPLIAHFFAPAAALGAPANERDHFAVVTRILPDGGFQSIDSNNLTTTTYLNNNFARNFSGYCLIVRPSLISRFVESRTAWLACVLLALMAMNALLSRYLRGR
jgi:ABC-type bacteriocin/lantibiotic exporter with double-glycine peptidase domain